jgi:hypothetical protein
MSHYFQLYEPSEGLWVLDLRKRQPADCENNAGFSGLGIHVAD